MTWSKILILGKGYIGNQVYNFLKDKHDCILVSSKELDYHDTFAALKYMVLHNVSLVINCSGFTGRPNVDEGELKKEECWQLNVVSPLKLNEVCDMGGIKYIHISSGCIYDGYDKYYTEEDAPNFGLFHHSSFYSKSKHGFEVMSKHLKNHIIRIRMPICDDLTNPRNYLKKIMEYPNLIDMVNSKTYIPDLCEFIDTLISDYYHMISREQAIYNVVNPNPLGTKQAIEILNEKLKLDLKPNWVELKDLKITAPRSNCVLDNTKASKIFKFKTEEEFLTLICDKNNV